MSSPENPVTGRAQTVLVSPIAGQPVAMITAIVARVFREGQPTRLVTAGPVRFDPNTLQHLQNVVLPAVDRVIGPLGWGGQSFELSVVSLAAATASDLGMEVEGHSLDTAAALAMLSAALQLPLREDVVSTGQVASVDGDVRLVRGLPEKLHAAQTTPGIREFLYPSLKGDQSLGVLTPTKLQETIDALAIASTSIRVTEVRDLAELIVSATTVEGRLQAALSSGYFHYQPETPPAATKVLIEGLEDGFWRQLEFGIYGGHLAQARYLLDLRLRADLKRNKYSSDFGSRLLALVSSIPPAVRRRRGFFPLVRSELCFQLGCLASAADQPDAVRLLNAAIGQLGDRATLSDGQASAAAASETIASSVDAILDAISAERLAGEVGVPADEARASFVLPTVIIEDYDQFNDTITAFHLALLRHTDLSSPPPQPDEALLLLERAYADAGGLPGARAEAKFAILGGMRTVLDKMTEQYKEEHRFKRVNRILKESLDPLDWEGQVEFMRVFLGRLRSHLPAKLRDADPARFARRREELVRAYVRGMDRVHSVIRTM